MLANSQARGKAFGVLKLTLRPAGYDWRFVPAVGATFTDSGSATCHGGDGSGDTQPPSLPSGLSASAPTSRRVELSWTAATDDVGVTGHEVYRDGVLTATAGPGVTFSDDTVVPASSYEYYVRARDAAGDVSAPSEPASVTTPPATGEATFVCWTRRERDDQLLVGDRSHVGHQAAARDGVYG